MLEKRILRELYLNYGDKVIFNYKVLRAHLLDMRVPKKTVNLLTDISRTDYFKSFRDEIDSDPEACKRLIYAVESEYALDTRAIKHGVCCWAYAFTGRAGADKESAEDDIWSEETAELVAAAIRELMQ